MIEKLIAEFEKLAYQVFSEEDFNKKNQIETKIERLVDKVYAQGLEKLFYDRLFDSTDPLTRVEIAMVSSDRNYDLYKSLEVLERIKHDAQDLVFFEDATKNEKWREYFSHLTNVQLKEKIAFFEEINDEYLFQSYYDCIRLFDQYYARYVSLNTVTEENKAKILSLLKGIKEDGKLDRFFSILLKQAEKDKSILRLILANYFSWTIEYQTEKSSRNLKQILKRYGKELNPKMLAFLRDTVDEIERRA
jgi:hypothetical protein